MPNGGAAVLLALAIAVGPARGDEPLPSVPLEALRGRIASDGPVRLGPRGLELEVRGLQTVVLPFPAQELELDLEVDGPALLTWSFDGERRIAGPPWRYAALRTGTFRLDLRQAVGFGPAARPLLLFDGVARVAIRALRANPIPADPAEARAAFDAARRREPESLCHSTINLLTVPWWSASRGIALADAVAAAAALVAAAVLAMARLRTGRWRPALALAAGAVAAFAAWDVSLVTRLGPLADLSWPPDREVRIRDHYALSPEVGALAALARRTLRADERVGVLGAEGDWFAPQTLCFNLAPRRCVLLEPGAAEHSGIQGVGRLRTDELDAVVVYGLVPVPPGFAPVAASGPRGVVARRP